MLKPIRVREFSPSGLLKCFPQTWNHSKMTYQSHDQFCDFGFQSVSFDRFAGRSVIPLPFSTKNNFFRMVLRRMSFLDAGLLQLCRTRFTFFCNRSFQSDSLLVGLCPGSLRCNSSTKRVFPRHMTTQEFRSGVVVDGSELQFQECQETEKYELEELVQLLFVLELRHKFWNLTHHKGVYTLCMPEFDLQNHHLRLQWSCSTFQWTLF